MRLINPSVELIEQSFGITGIYQIIEKVARTCYKSEDHITEDSAKPFVERMIKSQHLAMLEHGTVYLKYETVKDINNPLSKYFLNKYSKVTYTCDEVDLTNILYVTTNLRVLVEKGWMDDLQYLCEPTEYHVKRICLKFITSIGVSREGNRHRTFSIAEQSTRYCNYSKEKYGKEVTFVIPSWLDIPEGKYVGSVYETLSGEPSYTFECLETGNKYEVGSPEGQFLGSLRDAEEAYFHLLQKGWKPQQAREILPLSTATEVVYTAFEEDWAHFFNLRYRGTTGAPHPNTLQVATMAHDLIKEKLGKDL